MSSNLEDLVRRTESDIVNKEEARRSGGSGGNALIPRFPVAIVIWCLVVVLVSFQFSTITSVILMPADSKIEADLGSLVEATAKTLNNYRLENGSLPALLPNPSIRGLVKYETDDSFGYRLTATIGDVTMTMDSRSVHAIREYPSE